MKYHLVELLKEILKEIGISGVEPVVEISDDPQHGDYTTNVAMRVAKTLKKPPMEVALQVKEEFSKQKTESSHKQVDQNKKQKDQKTSPHIPAKKVLQDIGRIEVVAPGFINFFLTEAKLGTQVTEVLKDKEAFGTGKTEKPMRTTVEFTDPNPFKEFHVGHLYSNSVGESLCRLLESQGHTVRRVNYQGDVGLHVAKSLWGLWEKLKKDQKTLADLEKLPLPIRVRYLGESYALGSKAYEEDSQTAETIKHINTLAFLAAQQVLSEEKGFVPVVDYRRGVAVDKKELADVTRLYRAGRKWSLDYFELIYARLGTKFEGYYFESEVGEYGIQLVRKHIKDGIFEESDGAIVYRGEKKGLHTRVFVNTLGLPTYEAKELGLAPTKYKDWPYDRSIIVTGNEINEYFKVLIAALSEVDPALGSKTVHIGHGMVRKPDGSKMSSRSGEILTGEGLLDEVKESMYKILDQSDQKYSKEDREEIAEKAAVAAVKYSLLRVSLPSDVAFDIEKSVSFDGDSGPYLQYAYARCRSVLRKAQESGIVNGELGKKQKVHSQFPILNSQFNREERSVARLLLYFPEVVEEAAHGLAPSMICSYLFTLAQAFNLFYQKHPIIGSDTRLTLTAATAQVLKNGLYLLGIETVERM